MTSDAQAIVVAILLVILVVAVVLVIAAQRRRSQHLRDQFGSEYDRAVTTTGDPHKAEAELRSREKRREHLDIRPLSDTQRDRYVSDWKATQAKFVDDPRAALSRADALLREVMEARGYPTGDFDQRAADLSVDYSEVMNEYRRAHAITANSSRASTEDLRTAIVTYRSLFDRLVADRAAREPATHRG